MTSVGPRLATSPQFRDEERGRSPLAHLLHELNQPLTGLQCSMELAVAGPRPTDHYVRTLREGLELVSRMRDLVEAIREVVQTRETQTGAFALFRLDSLVSEVAVELEPIAAAEGVRLIVLNSTPLPVHSHRVRVQSLVFRTLDSILSLTRKKCEMRVATVYEEDYGCLIVTSTDGSAVAARSPFSRPELGLLVAQAGWEAMGATWTSTRTGEDQNLVIRMPLASFAK